MRQYQCLFLRRCHPGIVVGDLDLDGGTKLCRGRQVVVERAAYLEVRRGRRAARSRGQAGHARLRDLGEGHRGGALPRGGVFRLDHDVLALCGPRSTDHDGLYF